MGTQEKAPCRGVLELHPKGYGFLREPVNNLARSDNDVFVSESTVRKLRLREGADIHGVAERRGGDAGSRLVEVTQVNGLPPQQGANSAAFEDLTPANPSCWARLERGCEPVGPRVIDLLCPIGLGQRALIASPPKAGKTTLLKQIGQSIACNNPEIHLAALLIDERPEEVTDMRADISGEVFASSLDADPGSHVRLARLVLNRCRRLAESGRDVFLLVDSLTRLTRAANKVPGLSGPLGPGGLHVSALESPRRLFSSARAFAEGGSLTMVATVLIDTENRMDEVIYREFKGTGNMDLVLDQQLADRRVWPAVDIAQTSTRRVELLQDPDTLSAVTALRNSLMTMPNGDAMKELVRRLRALPSNSDLIELIQRASPPNVGR